MLPKFLKVLPEENSSILIRKEVCQYFENPYHFHPELELNLILKSTGTRFVGDSIGSFQKDDLVLLGPNIPHLWKNDPTYYDNKDSDAAQAVVIRFSEYFLGKEQYNMAEMSKLKQLFRKSERGLLIHGLGKERVIASIIKMVEYQGMERLIIFLGILNAIANACDLTFLSSDGFMTSLNPKNEKRMNNVYDFVTNNFRNRITLDQIADRASMNPSAFSRYFSQVTGKSITTFLQELRLGYACKLLIESDQKISTIIDDSGFQNQAYFNKLFVREKGMTPKKYRQMYFDN